MKINIQRTEDQLALVRAMGSNNREEAYEAQAAVAQLRSPVVSEVINNAVTVGSLSLHLRLEKMTIHLSLLIFITTSPTKITSKSTLNR